MPPRCARRHRPELSGNQLSSGRYDKVKLYEGFLLIMGKIKMQEIAYCGHHCKYCFYTNCSGCRSENPTCSYANLFEDKKCPNVTCCKNKGINGCYECLELLNCGHGFFSREDEQVAKATALFIQKHGLLEYDKTLKASINSGVKYPEHFNALNSVQKMIQLLDAHKSK